MFLIMRVILYVTGDRITSSVICIEIPKQKLPNSCAVPMPQDVIPRASQIDCVDSGTMTTRLNNARSKILPQALDSILL